MLSKTSHGLTAPELSGFFAVPSVAAASTFEGVEGTAKNGITVYRCNNAGNDCGHIQRGGFCGSALKQSCSLSTTATNSHI